MGPSQAERWGQAASLTPFAAAFEGGQGLAEGWTRGDLGTGLAGGLTLGMAMVPGIRPRWVPPTGRVTPDALEDTLREMGVRDLNRYTHPGGTTYLEFSNPLERGGATITVRAPEAPHAGNIRSYQTPGNLFDLAETRSRRSRGASFNPTMNMAGERFASWEALLPALRWRLSRDPGGGNWLVAPDQVPRGLREASDMPRGFAEEVARLRAQTPYERRRQTWGPVRETSAPSPEQLRLLGAGGAVGLGAPLMSSTQPAEASEATRRRLVPGIAATISIGGG